MACEPAAANISGVAFLVPTRQRGNRFSTRPRRVETGRGRVPNGLPRQRVGTRKICKNNLDEMQKLNSEGNHNA
jgi:hypothetical protein